MKKFALVTGASKGLGRAFALELGSRGINTILVSLPGEDIDLLNEEIISTYSTMSVFFEVDLSDYDNVISFSKTINETYSVFLLINNAGIGGTMKFGDSSVNLVNTIVQLNVMAVSILTRQLIPNLASQTQSFVLNISSLAAFNPVGYKLVYPASKAFVDRFISNANKENVKFGITCNTIQLGYWDGGMCYRVDEKYQEMAKEKIGLKRWGKIEELYNTIDYIIENEYISGTNLRIDGGL